MLCVLFGIAVLAGGITNLVYASDNRDLYDDSICSDRNGNYDNNIVNDACDDLQALIAAESAAAVSLGNYCNHI